MEKNNLQKALVGLAIVLGLSFVAGTFIVSNTFYKVKALSNVISVTGSADKLVTSDTAKWSSSFSRVVGVDGLKSGSTQLASDLESVKSYFAGKGITDKEITIKPVSVTSNCQSSNDIIWDKDGQKCSRVIGYTLSQSILIESSDVDKVTKLAQEASSALISKGLVFNSQNIEYYFNKLADLRIEMVSEATKNAQLRAKQIAESTGAQIGNLQAASLGVFQVAAPNSTDVSDYGIYDTGSMQKKVSATVRASFVLK
ncbi:MAG: SIMPL domain-containing protein [Minisyncoccota bacterium]